MCIPVLEKTSHLKANKDFYYGYSLERISPGDKKLFENIIKLTSGSNPVVARKINELYKKVIPAGTYLCSSIRVAEASKVIENTQRDVNIAFVNELTILFDKINLDINEVLDAASTKWNFEFSSRVSWWTLSSVWILILIYANRKH